MPSTINTNPPSLFTQNTLYQTQQALSKTSNALASGSRINSAADNAAAAAIVQLFAAQISGDNQAAANLNNGVSLTQVADGATQQLQDNTNRIRELAVQAGNGTLSAQDRSALQAEANQLAQSNRDIVQNTNFNGVPLLQGGANLSFQSGPNSGNQINLAAANLSTAPASGGLNTLAAGGVDFTNVTTTGQTLLNLDQDINTLASTRATLGAASNAFSAQISNLQTSSTNMAAAKSRIGDTDYAAATSDLAQQQIRNQAGLAMLAQANATPQQVLSLLR